jgi:hypothetical protein
MITPPRPAPVALAVKLVIAVAVVALLEALAVVLDVGGARSQAVTASSSNPQLTGTLTTVAVAAVVVGAVISATLWLVFGLLAGRGHGWARIVVTAFAGLAAVSSLFSLADGSLLAVTAALRLVLAVAVIVLLFRPEANLWYAQVKAARRPSAPPVPTGYPPAA